MALPAEVGNASLRLPDSDDEPEPTEVDLTPAYPAQSTSVGVPEPDAGWGAPEEHLLPDTPPMQRASATSAAPPSAFEYGDSPYAMRSVEEGSKGLRPSMMRPPNTDDDIDDDDRSANESDGLIAAALRPERDARAHVTAAPVVASRQALMNLVLWRNPILTGVVFLALNLASLLIIFAQFTAIGLLANAILVAIFVHVLYRLASIAYMRFTNKRLDAYAALKQHVGSRALDFTSVSRAPARTSARRTARLCGRALGPARRRARSRLAQSRRLCARGNCARAQVEETMAEVANTPLRVDFLTPLAGALEGGLNVCLCEVKDAVLLKSFGTCVKVTACAWFVAIFCASFDAAKVMYALIACLFTLPKLWSMRSSAVDELVRACARRGLAVGEAARRGEGGRATRLPPPPRPFTHAGAHIGRALADDVDSAPRERAEQTAEHKRAEGHVTVRVLT